MSVTAADMLSALQDAQFAIVQSGQQSYTIGLPGGGSQTFTALDLDKLQKLIDHYQAQAARATRKIFAPMQFQDPS